MHVAEGCFHFLPRSDHSLEERVGPVGANDTFDGEAQAVSLRPKQVCRNASALISADQICMPHGLHHEDTRRGTRVSSCSTGGARCRSRETMTGPNAELIE